jgi:protein-disulfide isomerase
MSRLRVPVGEKDHRIGALDAGCTVVEYGDYQCPHCRAAQPLVRQLLERYGEKICFVFRNFPLNQSHAEAQAAAETAEFAGSHGKFWEMHDALYEYQERLGEALYLEEAKALGLDGEALKTALTEGRFTRRVQEDFSGGVRSGVNGTPTFFIQGERHNGPRELETIAAKIDKALAGS